MVEEEKLRCLYCGISITERQCPRCRRKTGIVSEEVYRRGVEQAKRVLRGMPPNVPPFQGLSDVFLILSETFPNPFVPAKTLVDVIHQAQREMEEERKE